MAKRIYTATSPDGKTTINRTSERDYRFATWIQFPRQDHQSFLGFSNSEKPNLQYCEGTDLSHGIVPVLIIDRWFDREVKSWTILLKDLDGNQIADAEYVGSKREAELYKGASDFTLYN